MWRDSDRRKRTAPRIRANLRIARRTMPKQGIHPNYNETTVKCACGNNFQTRSTHRGDIVLEICSACHPFFTGKQKLIDTAGRIERFKRKYAGKEAAPAAK